MTRVPSCLSVLLLVGLVACVSTTKPEAVEQCARAGTCSDNPHVAPLPSPDGPADSLEPLGTGGSWSTNGTTSSAGAGGMTSTEASDATGGSVSASVGQGGHDATGDAAGGTRGLDGGPSSGGTVGSAGSIATGGTLTLSGGRSDAGGIRSTGGTTSSGTMTKGGATGSGGAPGTGGTPGAGGTTNPTAAVCRPLTAVINDFATSSCNYGNGTYGEMDSSAWTYANGASTVSATCASGNWTFSGTVGVATTTGANQAGFGFTLMGKVQDTATNAEVSCKTFDLSTYSGLSITLSSPSGAITSVGIGINLADGSKGHTEIAVTKTPTTLHVTWAQLAISSSAQTTGLWGYFLSGASTMTDDVVISHFGLQ